MERRARPVRIPAGEGGLNLPSKALCEQIRTVSRDRLIEYLGHLPACRSDLGLDFATLDPMQELVFEVTQEDDGGFVAECLTENIFTQAETWEQLRLHVKEAVEAFHFDRPMPGGIRLHLIRDEVLALR